MVDVDGSYLYKKYQHLDASSVNVAPLEVPPPLLTGWESVSKGNIKVVADTIPYVTTGVFIHHICC